MTDQPPQPDPKTVISVQQQEINRLNDNRVYLMAVLEEVRKEANEEIGRLTEEISLLKSSEIVVGEQG